MQPLNAIDAIAPAFTRAHQTLFHPFRIGRSWKLAASQYLGFIGAAFIPVPLFLPFLPVGLGSVRAVLLVIAIVATLITFGFFYLGVRMQMVNIEMLVTRAQFVAPMWNRYGRRVWPIIGFKVVIGTLLPLAMAPFLSSTIKGFIQVAQQMPAITPGTPPDPQLFQAFFAHMIGFYAVFFFAFLLLKLVTTSFEDFVQPFFILEDISLADAFRRGFAVIGNDPLQYIFYLVLKLILSIIGFIMQYISTLVIMIPLFLVGLIGAGIVFGLSAALHGSGGLGGSLLTALLVLGEIVFAALIFWYQIGSLGYLSTLLEAYGIYFLAGRYPLLASLLEAGPDKPFTPPPVFPSEEERGDDDGGPPMPMDPAVA